MLDSAFYSKNRKRLQNKSGSDSLIVISANGLIQKTRDDDTYPFKQDSNFLYLCGINEPDLILVIYKNYEYLILPKRDKRHEVFSESVDVEKLKQTSGLQNILDYKTGWTKLSDQIQRIEKLHCLKPKPVFLKSYDVYTNPANRKNLSKLKSKKKGLVFVDITKDLYGLRRIKSEAELNAISDSINLTKNLVDIIVNNLSVYKNEADIYLEIINFVLKNQIDTSFHPIIASGNNATTLHYSSNNMPINKTKMLLVDLGVFNNGYCSDITRTFNLSRNKRQEDIKKAVFSVQAYAMSIIKPGLGFREYEQKVRKILAGELVKLKLIDSLEDRSQYEYYPHGTSHSLGLDCHDPNDYSLPMSEGMVITVEPGIYIKDESIGVRIEDNVVITKSGVVNLSDKIVQGP